jgi:hypothetical protein
MPAGVPSRKKFEGLKLLKPQPPKPKVSKPERTRSINTPRIIKKVPSVARKLKKSSNEIQV